MKQVTQRLRNGRIEVLDVPAPALRPDTVLIDVRASLLSAGTERAKVQAGRQSLVAKARSRPDQVRQVMEKAQRDGVRETVATVRARLEAPSPLGYSLAGVAMAVGARVADVQVGDRVAAAGAEHAFHAEVVSVPGNLCVPVPDGVGFDHAAFTTVGSIALHGVRQSEARLGERVAVIGMGLVGQLAAQLLRAAGCRVIGIDLSPALLDRARQAVTVHAAFEPSRLAGPALPVEATECDAILITASTSSDDPVRLAAKLARDRGRVVVVGDVGLALPRAAYYDKELEIRLSRSYGPGRYDTAYEQRGLDYPIGYVRWTERRNMQAFLELVAGGQIDAEALVAERHPIDEAPAAYERLLDGAGSPLGLLLQYPAGARPLRHAVVARTDTSVGRRAGVIGTGSFAQRVLIPALTTAGFGLEAVASGSGLAAVGVSEDAPATRALQPDELIADPHVDVVVIASRHDTHTDLAVAALEAGKAVFVEKPPALTVEDLDRLATAQAQAALPVAVGFNRRHAPMALAARAHVREAGAPFEVMIRVSAGRLADKHWLNDLDEGGGRLLGEGCHFVDLACWLVGALPSRVSCTSGSSAGRHLQAVERFAITLEFPDGSLAAILCGDSGASGLRKEHVELHGRGRSAVVDDFRSLRLYGDGRARIVRRGAGDKGHVAQLEAFRSRLDLRTRDPQPGHLATMAVTFDSLEALRTGVIVSCAARS